MRKMIEFWSREQMKDACEFGIANEEDIAIISVSDTPDEYNEMVNLLDGANYTAVMFPDDDTGMTPLQAKTILSFINKNRKKDFMVHCFAGVSRSGAIAKFINEYFDCGIWYLEDYKGHNRKVFDQLHAAAGTSIAAYYEEMERQDRRDSNE